MKLLLTTLALLFSQQSFAADAPVYYAQLTRFAIDENLSMAKMRITDGDVTVDLKNNKIRVNLYGAGHCPAVAMCLVPGPTPVTIELPITERAKDNCGVAIVRAMTKEMIPGGVVERLEVRDNSRSTCPRVALASSTEVIYETSQALPPGSPRARTSSKFEGYRLEKAR